MTNQTMSERLKAAAARRATEAAGNTPPPATGVAGSAGPSSPATADSSEQQATKFPTKRPAIPEYPAGCYTADRQRFLILHTGAKVMPDAFGVFVPASDEEREILETLDKRDRGLVHKLN